MQLGMIGLGRMGANMVRRLIASGHECVVFDRVAASGDGAREGEGDRAPPRSQDLVEEARASRAPSG